MFDVTDKRAVDRLAAVVAMLEQREREARAVFDAASAHVRATASTDIPLLDQVTPALLKARVWRALDRWTEAQSALAAARELATDR